MTDSKHALNLCLKTEHYLSIFEQYSKNQMKLNLYKEKLQIPSSPNYAPNKRLQNSLFFILFSHFQIIYLYCIFSISFRHIINF